MFIGRADCAASRSGPYLTDERLHNTGVSWGGGDVGREDVTGHPADRGRFRTPSLRDVAITPPYVHDGSLGTQREVIEFYDQGGGANPHLDARLRPLRLTTAEWVDLLAFLEALTGGARHWSAMAADGQPVH